MDFKRSVTFQPTNAVDCSDIVVRNKVLPNRAGKLVSRKLWFRIPNAVVPKSKAFNPKLPYGRL